ALLAGDVGVRGRSPFYQSFSVTTTLASNWFSGSAPTYKSIAFWGRRSDNHTQGTQASVFSHGDRAMRATRRFCQLRGLAILAVILAPSAMATAAERIDGTFSASDGVKIHFIEMGQGTPVI